MLCQSTATVQDLPKATQGHSILGEAFDEGPRRQAVLLLGMGRVDFPASTTKPEAGLLMTQGVAQLHSFYYFEAERSFRQAAMVDPDCPMAYWGMAMANINNPRRAKGFLKQADDKASKATITRRERLYLDALVALFRESGGGQAGPKGYIAGLEAVVRESPEDLDARAWLVLAAYQFDQVGSRQALDIVLESVLRAAPDHPGAHHYRIHLWDGVMPTQALNSAAAYAKSAPGIAHAWHMPGHTYTESKRHADAARHQEAASRVDHAAMLRDRTMPFEIHNYAHNQQWLCTSLGHVGRAREAIAIAKNLVALPRDPDKNRPGDPHSAQRLGRLRLVETMIRFELWDELIEAANSGALDWSGEPAERVMKAYSLGLAHAARGEAVKLAEQVAALQALAAERTKKDAEARPKDFQYEIDSETAAKLDQPEVARRVAGELRAAAEQAAKSATTARAATPELAIPHSGDGPSLEAALAELDGYLLLARGDIGMAFVKFSKANSMRPEARAKAHLKVKNLAFAETTARTGLERAPGEIPALICLVEILQAVGKEREAREAYRQLEPLARRADADLPATRRLAEIVARWKEGGSWSPSPPPADDRGEDLPKLGPLTWSPFAAADLQLPDSDGHGWSLSARRGRGFLLLFHLGGSCAPCLKGLQEFGKASQAFQALGVDMVAIGPDDVESAKNLKENRDGLSFPMPMLADPKLAAFRAFGCYDEFEDRPLHGAILVDAEGLVRYQRISAEPFVDIEFLKAESRRMVAPKR